MLRVSEIFRTLFAIAFFIRVRISWTFRLTL